VGGRGGGKAAMAQGGGDDASGLDAALEAARGILRG
jgi:alanyl-tRNA synthetase